MTNGVIAFFLKVGGKHENEMLGLKEIYNLIIKTTYDIEIDRKTIKAGEPIVIFDRIQLANFQEIANRIEAKGGFGNSPRVSWNDTQELNLSFTQGVFSRLHFAIMGNSRLTSLNEVDAPIEEFRLELNEEREVELKKLPSANLFIYSTETGEKVEYSRNGKVVTVEGLEPYSSVDAFYDFTASAGTSISIGRELLNGYLTVQAKTRLKDDRTGKIVTGIFKIPRAKLVSDFSIRLGSEVSPGIGHFQLVASPTGSKGSQTVMDFIMLNDDIDSDM